MDMNASYSQLLKTVFPNAEIVTDCFHIIQHINRTFNHLRIKEMNRLKRYDQTEAKQYRRLKRYWKLLLKDISELKYAYKINDYSIFLELCSHVQSELPTEFKGKFRIFNKFSQGVTNVFKYSYSNGFLEGVNNKIKVIKRVAYAYLNFLIFKRRIFLIQNQVFETK